MLYKAATVTALAAELVRLLTPKGVWPHQYRDAVNIRAFLEAAGSGMLLLSLHNQFSWGKFLAALALGMASAHSYFTARPKETWPVVVVGFNGEDLR